MLKLGFFSETRSNSKLVRCVLRQPYSNVISLGVKRLKIYNAQIVKYQMY